MTPPGPAAPPPPPGSPGPRDLSVLGGAALVLALLLAVLGALGWPAPERSASGWQVADVPASLLVLVIAAGVVCLVIAAVLTRPWQLPAPVAVLWWSFGLTAVFAHGWNDLYLAALADPDGGALIPVFAGFFTFIPAVVVGGAAGRAGRPVQLRAGLGTAVVGVPLMALGWSLYGAPEGVGSAVLNSLGSTAFFGVAPVAVALALATRLGPQTATTG